MSKQTWFITGISSGFGLELAKQLLAALHIPISVPCRNGTDREDARETQE
ncbi:hypothetical protein [Bifidobacterium xylocopae]|nr:hypothetical protein [Bifidobacterium xylocopae]